MKILRLIAALVVFPSALQAEEKEPAAVVELGGAGAWISAGGGSSLGPSVSVEFSPIKNLSIEAGLSPLFGNGPVDWDFDLLFRRPFDLSKTVEFDPGIGPTWGSTGQFGAQASFEFMFWPWNERKFGWFIDPTYGVSFTNGHQQSFGLTVGLLIGIPDQKGPPLLFKRDQ